MNLTIGHVLRHAPSRGGQGLEAALIDIAQDLLLRELSTSGVMDDLAFKGGTALRKLYAGPAGRFSTDLDFSVRSTDAQITDVVELLVEAISAARIGPFGYAVSRRRGKPYVVIETDLGSVEPLTCKLDVSPPPWLPAERRPWIPMPIHAQYGGSLPELHVVQLEENIAEKIARLNRATPARDAYDLVWIMRNRPRLGREVDLDLIRRLAVLKAWVDMNGLETPTHRWGTAHEPRPFDVETWLRARTPEEFDDATIGLLATPPPALDELAQALSAEYEFLRKLTPEEEALAACNGRDRTLLLRLLASLPRTRLPQGSCW
ncbi:MAG: nucleotidyl transferase AbiEii/AbiGii toxin family protein [Planctomycetota bacterium]